MQEAMLLRVSQTSEFGKGLDALLKNGQMTKQELEDVGGLARTSWAMKVARVWFDNLIVEVRDGLYSAEYINVVPGGSGYYLRIRENGDLGKALRHLLSVGRPVGEDELAEVAGLERIRWSIKLVAKWFDNIAINWTKVDGKLEFTAHYSDVAPRSSTTVLADGLARDQEEGIEPVDPIRWPEAPPLLEPFDFFRKPNYYDTMRMMVNAGRHISLEGPPGTGKDTAVMQLAAEEGKVLVTIGADGGVRKHHLEGHAELVNGSSYFSVSPVAAAAVNGYWLLVTEINAANPDEVNMFFNPILETPHVVYIHGTVYPVHPDFRMFITYNAGLVGTKPMAPSFKDRFFSIKMGFFSEHQLRIRLQAHGLPTGDDAPAWADAIVQFGLSMWQAHENGSMRYQITVRRLIDAIELCSRDMDVRTALKLAVVDAIDSPVERKAAEGVLKEVMQEYESAQDRVRRKMHDQHTPSEPMGGCKFCEQMGWVAFGDEMNNEYPVGGINNG